ncbi:sugar phosphate isomerase/epimerase [Occultella aeris]|uniref:Xylose isomerase-like TIM barrel n=1 Tax=Occultella aeris TaxID=2761496 RepID=A0A7M4DLJ5_9MICO|nr:TIM barrel protein [Occultella aeris]VZO38155.1 Xylose isomerase-like TIM barrel [Occultella aeris]
MRPTTDDVTWSVFTKPWSAMPPGPLGELVAGLGFAGAEVPVRPGCYLDPDNVGERLADFVRSLAEYGVKVTSVAADPVEPVLAACAEAGVSMVRTMAPVDQDYRAGVGRLHREWATAVPWCDRYGVTVVVQQHHGTYVESTLGILQLIEDLPGFKLAWDAAHDALTGVDPVRSLELAGPRLGQVNLKNARYRRVPDPVSGAPRYRPWFGPAESGMADWSRVLAWLHATGWSDPICLHPEYTDAATTERHAELARADLDIAQSLWPA